MEDEEIFGSKSIGPSQNFGSTYVNATEKDESSSTDDDRYINDEQDWFWGAPQVQVKKAPTEFELSAPRISAKPVSSSQKPVQIPSLQPNPPKNDPRAKVLVELMNSIIEEGDWEELAEEIVDREPDEMMKILLSMTNEEKAERIISKFVERTM